MIKPPKNFRSIEALKNIMNGLLSQDGCPWDRKQTPQSIAPNALEEAYELVEALEKNDKEAIQEELGDVLLQVIFQSTMAEQKGDFNFEDVVEGIGSKLVRRHPHVFGENKAANAEEALKSWNQSKNEEKKSKKTDDDLGIPMALPSLQRSHRIGVKSKSFDFDWQNADEVYTKVEEEFEELREALERKDKKHIAEELGDLFFVLAQLARHLDLEAETVAREANRKFENRFRLLSQQAKKEGRDLKDMTSQEKEDLWQKVKKTLKTK